MAGEAAATPWVSYEAYLAMERATNTRHTWLDGQAYAMAGGTITHGELAAAVLGELRNLALECGCRVFSSDVKVRVGATGLATYPDASVVCGPVERDAVDPHALGNPTLIVEVLSEGTEAFDRGTKSRHYRQIPSLKDYVLVSQTEPLIEVWSRDGERWVLREATAGGTVPLTAMPGALAVDRVYQGVELA